MKATSQATAPNAVSSSDMSAAHIATAPMESAPDTGGVSPQQVRPDLVKTHQPAQASPDKKPIVLSASPASPVVKKQQAAKVVTPDRQFTTKGRSRTTSKQDYAELKLMKLTTKPEKLRESSKAEHGDLLKEVDT